MKCLLAMIIHELFWIIPNKVLSCGIVVLSESVILHLDTLPNAVEKVFLPSDFLFQLTTIDVSDPSSDHRAVSPFT